MKKYLFLALSVMLPMVLFAQVNFLPINVDYASFKQSDTSAYVEIYVSIFQGNLTYQSQPQGGYEANFSNTLEIKDLNGKVVEQLTHNYKNQAQDTSGLNMFNQFVDIFSVELPYGNYKARVHTVDNVSNQTGEYVFDLNTIRNKKGVFLSDVELCMDIKRSAQHDRFYKSGLRVVPNPRPVFDVLQPMLYFYVELNNMSVDQNKDNQYQFEYYVTNADGDTLKSRPPVQKKVAASTLVEIGGFNCMALPPNNYLLTVKVTDLASGQSSVRTKPFYVYKPQKNKQKNQNIATSGGEAPEIDESIALLTKEQLQKEFKMASYIATRQEEKVFNNLQDPNAMRKFLTQFWYRRDRANNLPLGTFRTQYLQRVEQANERFHSMGKEGWRTDRGRIFIVYGEPDEIERHPSSMDLVPYVVWYYHGLEGGSEFIFADQRGFGEYELIHSTYRKELQNPNWREIITKKSAIIQSTDGF